MNYHSQYKQSNLEFQEYFSCFAYIFFHRIFCLVLLNKKPPPIIAGAFLEIS